MQFHLHEGLPQLITDFGRTANLSQSAKYRAKAEEDNAQVTRDQILLAVDSAFYGALQAQAVTKVARQTVTSRQVFLDQVSALASNKLRSELDVSFAKVNVDDNPRVATEYGVRSIPTLLVFKDGKPVKQIVGLRPKAELKKQLDDVLAGKG